MMGIEAFTSVHFVCFFQHTLLVDVDQNIEDNDHTLELQDLETMLMRSANTSCVIGSDLIRPYMRLTHSEMRWEEKYVRR